MDKKLSVVEVVKEGIGIGMVNMVPILVNTLLWILTIWIPYLNIGTTIGMVVGIVAKASKGESISMTEIFNPQYRKYMGEFFLTSGFVSMGVGAALVFLIIPGIVLAIAWSLALLLAVDKEKNPMEAISLSNKITYGNKWAIFLSEFVVLLGAGILSGVFSKIPGIGGLLVLAVMIVAIFAGIGIRAYIYKTLTSNV
ncbi:MAG: hypothetical protein JW875_09660 [Spirochaetales bacterium]|nr:hypothetical protein [Spirochaetales bacterium]